MRKIKIGYFADGPWGHYAFELLNNDERFEIGFICVRYDSEDEVFIKLANDNNIDLIKHRDVNSDEFLNEIHKYLCDIFVSMSFNQILRTKFINFTPLKTINCHAGKLPFYRGRNILNWVLINDEKEFGITVHYIDEGIDTGDIILQQVYPISDEDDYNTILNRAYIECSIVLHKALILIYEGNVKPIKQENIHPIGHYCIQRKNGDEKIDWNNKSREIFNFVRSICKPGPIARTRLGEYELKINRVSLINSSPTYKLICGAIVGITEGKPIVKTRDSTICIEEYESERKLRIGDRLK